MHKSIFTALIGITLCCSLAAQSFPYQDASLSPEKRADDILTRLTVEQKISLMMNSSPAIPELGIKQYDWWNEALHGAARAGLATVFPQAIGMASSWDDELLEQVFDIASTEQRIKFIQYRRDPQGNPRYHGLTVWTPNINIFRDPRWGRGQETYGEDPYLTARMGYAVVKGLQGPDTEKYDKLHACLKHYAVHSGPESERHFFDADEVSMRDLMETYLYAFESIIKKIDVQEVMCAYNRFDGKPCCGSDQLLVQLLRNKWGFKGIVTSDCGAIDDFWKEGRHETFLNDPAGASANAVRTGTDIECGSSYKHLLEAYEQGRISEAEIDTSLRRLFIARFKLGEMDPDDSVSWNHIDENLLACDKHHEVAVKMARESMVLLQNKGILPLRKEGVKYAVIGPNAADSTTMWGNYNGFPRHTYTALECITDKVGAENVTDDASKADVIIFVGGISPRVEGEQMRVVVEGFNGGDRTTIELPRAQKDTLKLLAASGKPVVFVNMSGSAMGLLSETETCDAILQAWYPGEAGGIAIADVLFGDYNPAGRLPVTFYRSDSDLPDFHDYNMTGRTYRYFNGTPLWHFGYGLSYTTFKYGKPHIRGGKLVVKVRNTGKMDGDEVVQVYVRKDDDTEGPKMSLRGFKRVHIRKGAGVRVKIPMEDAAFASFDLSKGEMTATPGQFTVFCGPSSDPASLKEIKVTRK